MELRKINDDVKAAHDLYAGALHTRLKAEATRRQILECGKNAVAANKDEKGKAPSEAACERTAKGTPDYIAAVDAEVDAQAAQEKALSELQYAQRTFELSKLSVSCGA